MDSTGGEVDDEINATAEVRYRNLFVLFAWCLLFILLTVSHFYLWLSLQLVADSAARIEVRIAIK